MSDNLVEREGQLPRDGLELLKVGLVLAPRQRSVLWQVAADTHILTLSRLLPSWVCAHTSKSGDKNRLANCFDTVRVSFKSFPQPL